MTGNMHTSLRLRSRKKADNHTHNSQPNVSLSLVDITGRTTLSAGISETRENKNIAASKD